jgi:2-oxo-4-hydroxy-4-carboxy-5-ureidoimidazoline decarboxylase
MHLEQFNALSQEQARSALDPCLGVERWVDEVVDARPYDDLCGLVTQASASAQQLTDDELAAALSRHPRIGERPAGAATEAAFSRHEQAGVDPSDLETLERIRQGNKDYEARFDQVFLIRAAGRSSSEILAELERRLHNDEETERREVVAQLREIALRRLDEVVSP